jgi:hypothetical protein
MSHSYGSVRLQPDFCDGPPKGGHYRRDVGADPRVGPRADTWVRPYEIYLPDPPATRDLPARGNPS